MEFFGNWERIGYNQTDWNHGEKRKMSADVTKLPDGIADFRVFKQNRLIYVDKTRMIYELAGSLAPVFLSRPRRFGKSLLVSTFESLFSKGLEDFRGLEIEKLWKDDKTYRIMRFDFSRMSSNTALEFKRAFVTWIKEIVKPYGFVSRKTNYDSLITEFDFWLQAQPPQKYVLLIDEYDNPLTGFLNKPKDFETALSALSDFYATIKGNSHAFRFIFITGIARFQKASIFSKMNTLDDITLDTAYGTILGYTQEELEKYFSPYLDNAANVLGMPREELLMRMAEQYDGFCFDRRAKYRLYAPWSVLKFLRKPDEGFFNYWMATGGSPTLFLNYYAKHSMKSPEEFTEERSVTQTDLEDPVTLDKMKPLVLLTQAGYYTIDYPAGDRFFLRYPNEEVRQTMAKRYKDALYGEDTKAAEQLVELPKAIESGNPEEINEIFNKITLNVTSGNNKILISEEWVRNFLLIVLLSQGVQVIPEKINAVGRADLVVIYKDQCVVFEFKFCYDGDGHPKESSDALLKEAVKQLIEKKYGFEIIGKKVLRVAMVFSQKERSFVRWQVVD